MVLLVFADFGLWKFHFIKTLIKFWFKKMERNDGLIVISIVIIDMRDVTLLLDVNQSITYDSCVTHMWLFK